MGERATELMPQTERRLQEWEGKGGEEWRREKRKKRISRTKSRELIGCSAGRNLTL